jgi:hypothetical protein
MKKTTQKAVPGVKPLYDEAMLPIIIQLMSKGSTPVQVAAALHVPVRVFQNWLYNTEPKYNDLRDAVEMGMTACEAYWESVGQQAMVGEIKDFRDSIYKLYMGQKFKWSEKQEITTIGETQKLLSDEELENKIGKYLAKLDETKET